MAVMFYSAIFLIIPCNSYAYIDPGSGSLAVQILLAIIVGVVFKIRFIFSLLLNKIRTLFPKS